MHTIPTTAVPAFKKMSLLAFLLAFSMMLNAQSKAEKLTNYVNPFIGTDEDGHTFPGALVPFGMVQLSPDNGQHGYNWCAGYYYGSDQVAGFSHTHFSGTGAEDLCDISVFPMLNQPPSPVLTKSFFSHDKEQASPGYYSVDLQSSQIKAELTASVHCGFHRYSFPAGKNPALKIDLGFGNGTEARVGHNGNEPLESFVKKLNDSTVVGYRKSIGFVGERIVYFAARTNRPARDMVIFCEGVRIQSKESGKAVRVVAWLPFSEMEENGQVMLKVAISTGGFEGALAGLQEIRDWNFDKQKARAEAAWETELKKIQITSADTDFKQTFYTALYHCYFAPFRFDDYQGNFRGADGKIYHEPNTYTLQSLWDTYRAAAPLFTFTQTARIPAIIRSFLSFYRQHGLLPSWELYFQEANVMPGYHAVPIMADAILKGIGGFDYETAFESMKATANQNIRESDFYKKFGYVPDDLDPRQRGVTKTVEYAFDDWCIAQVAKKLKKHADYKTFMQRSDSWRNVFDRHSGFARPKDSKGRWMIPFDPKSSTGFQEGNAWIYTWYVPQNIHGLIAAMGGAKRFSQKLDSLYQGKGRTSDLKNHGFYGLCEFANEPSHHVPYLYNYTGEPWKSAEKIQYILKHFYSNKPNGLCGNDDCGQMSAWYVLSAMGFYPVNPVGGEYAIGSPLVEKARIAMGNGKIFNIEVVNLSPGNSYVQKALLNGKPHNKSFLQHSDMMKGGKLTLFMGAAPSRDWAVRHQDVPGRNLNF